MVIIQLEVNKIAGLCLDLSNLTSEADKIGASDKFKGVLNSSLSDFDLDPIAGSKMLFGGPETFKAHKLDLNGSRVESFLSEYKRQLVKTYSPETHLKGFEDTFNRMAFSILEGTFSKDSGAIKATCKALKVKHTYKAIQGYFSLGL